MSHRFVARWPQADMTVAGGADLIPNAQRISTNDAWILLKAGPSEQVAKAGREKS